VKRCACFSFTLQITQHPQLSPIPAPHSPGSAGAAPAKVVAIGREDLIDKSRTAKDRSIGQVADPVTKRQLLASGNFRNFLRARDDNQFLWKFTFYCKYFVCPWD